MAQPGQNPNLEERHFLPRASAEGSVPEKR